MAYLLKRGRSAAIIFGAAVILALAIHPLMRPRPIEAAEPPQLLKAGSGTDSSARPAVVDTISISGLTAHDRLQIYYTIRSAATATAAAQLFNTTDSVAIGQLTAGSQMLPSSTTGGVVMLSQEQQSPTVVFGFTSAYRAITGAGVGAAVGGSEHGVSATVTTAWTGNWTLGLRHGGVTAGGTFHYSWSVLKVAGQ